MLLKGMKSTINPPVFFVSAGMLLAFLAFGVFLSDQAQTALPALLDGVSSHFGWLYVISVSYFILFAVWLLLSPYGSIRLGDDDERPRYSTPTWFAMLFSAGMGIGLVFYGVAEPIMHYARSPTHGDESVAAARDALPTTFFHWGVHAWGIYVLMALAISYFAYRKKLPLAIRSCFYPLLGERIHGWPGHLVDILAVFGTLFGLATSLGLGAMQVSAGLHHLFGVSHSTGTQLTLIALITFAATLSLISGVDKGIRRLSELNISLAGLLLLFVFCVGPTNFIIDAMVQSVGEYVNSFVSRSFRLGVWDGDSGSWIKSWTLFYWGWWIAWAPFVGLFIARVSRGRTIRELILGVLLAPTAVTIVWMSVFGGTALHLELFADGGIAAAVNADVATAIYATLEKLPLATITSFLAATVVVIFFITSSDSASFVVDMLTSGGHPDPARWQRVFWAVAEGACAAVLLYAGGAQALKALQAAVISVGLPYCIVLILMTFSLIKALRTELHSSGDLAQPGNPGETASAPAAGALKTGALQSGSLLRGSKSARGRG